MDELTLNDCVGFDWGEGNENKNLEKHGVSKLECEQIFFNQPLLLYEDLKHSLSEKRVYVLGQTDGGKKLFIAFTLRNKLIRVISARSMSKKEGKVYEQP